MRDAVDDDWPAIWAFLRPVIAAGETFSWDRDIDEGSARAIWMRYAPGVTLVAVDDSGAVRGAGEFHPNHGGGGRHVANASFVVDPAWGGKGIGRLLGERVLDRARADGFAAMVFNAVVESNVNAAALWRSLGFEVLTTIPEAFDHPRDGLVGLHVMHRTL